MNDIRSQFSFFKNNPDLIYLDTASTALVPQVVIDAMNNYYTKYGVNVNRGIYELSGYATDQYEQARDKVAKLLNAERDEIIFTQGTTAGLNMLADMLCKDLKAGDNIVVTRMEHHANLIPWQMACKRIGAELRFIELTELGTVDHDSVESVIDKNTKIVSVTMISNVLGTVVPVEAIVKKAKEVGAVSIIDGAQGIVHSRVDIKKLDCDFFVFSGHKLYGPTGIGVVYGKKVLLEALEPVAFGGDMIKYVSYEDATWADLPHKFEPGTPPIAEAIGLAAAIDFVNNLGWDEVAKHEHELTAYGLERLSEVATIIGSTDPDYRCSALSFLVDDVHPHDAGDILNMNNICVRVGHHCAMPLIQHLGIVGTVRASLGVYNNKSDIDRLVNGIEEVRRIFLL